MCMTGRPQPLPTTACPPPTLEKRPVMISPSSTFFIMPPGEHRARRRQGKCIPIGGQKWRSISRDETLTRGSLILPQEQGLIIVFYAFGAGALGRAKLFHLDWQGTPASIGLGV